MKSKTTIEDLVGIEHSKLNFFQELQQSIEELKESNQELEEQRRETAAILDGITDVMMVLSEDLRIISVNHVFMQLFPDSDPRGQYCYKYFRHTDTACKECPAFRSLSTDTVCRETAIFRINGRNMQFEMVASPLKSPYLPEHRVLIFKRDVTLEKEYQAKFYQAEKMATMGVLAAGVAHEINNPLTAVTGFAEGIRRRLPRLQGLVDEQLFTDFQEYTDTILKECLRCQDIVQTLLTFSRPSSSDFSPLSLNAVVSETVWLLHNHFKKHHNIKVNMNLDDTIPHIFGDEAQLKQVILNLLTNALDSMSETSNKDRCYFAGELTVQTIRYGDEGAQVIVSDTGCGIAKEILDKLFEPFFTTKSVGKGIGIGLSTCYSIVRQHGGEITVKSTEGKGSRFTVTLPGNHGERRV
ncbi:ATP-binding protein [Oleidesulfovibrio sp.]|uniref:ATP-binding protein n=1 Tax=Oleidesulfovibrio sp. TaxID=2909707 RepID=UPI003A897C3D